MRFRIGSSGFSTEISAADFGEASRRVPGITTVELLPEPPAPKCVLFVPTGRNAVRGEYRGSHSGKGPMYLAESSDDETLPGYRRVEVDIRAAVERGFVKQTLTPGVWQPVVNAIVSEIEGK